jgi:polyhydroxyalkanoate synthesis regulator phasin
MRRYLLALLAVLALFAAACGASGDDDAADVTTTTSSESGDEADETTTTTTEDEGGGDPSGDGVEVEEWADQFCGGFEGWLDGVTATSESLEGSIQPGDLEGAKTAIVGLFADVGDQTQELIDEIEAIGAPDIDDGEAFQQDLLGKFEDFHAAIDTARTEAEAASTADPAAFQATITELLSTFEQETQEIGDSFAELDAKYADAGLNAAVSESCSFM